MREGVAAYTGVVDHYLLRTVARYAEVHSALQPAGEAARLELAQLTPQCSAFP